MKLRLESIECVQFVCSKLASGDSSFCSPKNFVEKMKNFGGEVAMITLFKDCLNCLDNISGKKNIDLE